VIFTVKQMYSKFIRISDAEEFVLISATVQKLQ